MAIKTFHSNNKFQLVPWKRAGVNCSWMQWLWLSWDTLVKFRDWLISESNLTLRRIWINWEQRDFGLLTLFEVWRPLFGQRPRRGRWPMASPHREIFSVFVSVRPSVRPPPGASHLALGPCQLASGPSQLALRPSPLALRPSQLAPRLTQLDLRPFQRCSFLRGSLSLIWGPLSWFLG